ncbi:MAG TPA: entericidin A/B family lipoprotein [Casimicrobiaceae bacterium]
MTRLIALICAAAFTTMLVGCNTVEGAGKDVKAGGNAVEKAADKAKPN